MTLKLPRFLLCILLLAFSGGLFASTLQLEDIATKEVASFLYYLEDNNGSLTIEQLLEGDHSWQRNGNTAFNRGYRDTPWWLKVRIHNPHSQMQHRLLELSYATLDFVDIYVVSKGELITSYQTGDMRPFNSRPQHYRAFITPLDWQPGQTLDIYYRIKTSGSMLAPLTLWQQEAFNSYEIDSNILHGLYYGALAILVVYNLLIFLVLRDRSYLYYVGFISSGPLFFLSLSGQGYHYLWTDQINWNAHSIAIFISSMILFGSLFTRNFIDLKKVSMFLDRGAVALAIIGGLMMVLSFLLPYSTTVRVLAPMGVVACIIGLIAGCIAWYRGITSARIYVIAWSSFLLGTIVLVLQKFNLLPANVFTEYSVQLGSALEAVLLSFALAERITLERKLRFEAQEETLRTAHRLNVQLEQRVLERTAELESLNEKLEALSHTDQLTGLYNRRFLEQSGSEEWSRCKRYKHDMSIMLMDIDFFKQVNDKYGHHAGDICLQSIADNLKNCLRLPTDVVARYGGEEFCILLPETRKSGAHKVAERIRKQIERTPIKAEGVEFCVTVSIGVYCAEPAETGSIEIAIKFADQALYLSKQNGRNQVTVSQGSATVTPLRKDNPPG